MSKLNFGRRFLLIAIGFVAVFLPTGFGQSKTATTAAAPSINFDVVSVRQDKSEPDKNLNSRFHMKGDGDSISYINMPLFYIVLFSNNFHRFDLAIGLPEWTKTERYDVTAKVAASDVDAFHKLTGEQRLQMFQKVLADRFKLQAHREPREMPVYDLVVAKSGVKMKEAPPGVTYADDLKAKYGQNILFTDAGHLVAQGAVVSDLALLLSDSGVGRQVVDKTGLTGKYDFTLQWTPDRGANSIADGAEGSPAAESSGPSLFTAIQEQLGLKLESSKGMVGCFVVDHIERPAAD